jgi:hypothetical protein
VKWELASWKKLSCASDCHGRQSILKALLSFSCVRLVSQGTLTRRPEGESWSAFGLIRPQSQEASEK